jgi:hypothetical protein
MKNIFFILAFIATTFVAQAQVGVTVQSVNADDVPAAVISSQASYFPGVNVNVWEQQTAKGPNKSAERYIANFQNNGQKARARYYPGGMGTTATTYYSSSQLPTAIQEAAATNYEGYTLNSGEQIVILPTSDIFYRLRLRKGPQKLVVYTDETGTEISPDDLPEVMQKEQ